MPATAHKIGTNEKLEIEKVPENCPFCTEPITLHKWEYEERVWYSWHCKHTSMFGPSHGYYHNDESISKTRQEIKERLYKCTNH